MSDDACLCWENLDPGMVRLSLDHGRGNPLSRQLIDELEGVLGDLEASPPRALILDGGAGKLFSGGFDLREVLGFDARDARRFFKRFFELLARLTELPCPTIAAIHGAAVAGGFLLPLACDLRVVQQGPHVLGLTEVDLGVAVPAGCQVLLAARTSDATALRLSTFGTLLTPDEAHAVGYADALHEDARAEAIALARRLAEKPGFGVSMTKQLSATLLAQRVRDADARGFEGFFASWMSEPAQAALHALAARLAG